MKGYYLTRQKGTTMFLLLVFLVGMFGFIGLATDSGHLLINKTRLQNAMDAAALSAAIALNNDATRDMNNATTKGKDTFDLFKGSAGNGELSSVNRDDLTFEFSRDLNPFTPIASGSTVKPAFVRVSTSSLAVSPILIQIVSSLSGPVNVYSVSTAGLNGQNCQVTPFVMCADMPAYDASKPEDFCIDNPDDEYCQPLDSVCDTAANNGTDGTPDYDGIDDGDGIAECFGYQVGEINSVIVACNGNDNGGCPEGSLESGNYNLLDLDSLQGGRDIKDAIESEEGVNTEDFNACTTNVLNTKPGYTWGNVRAGINNRFDSDTVTTEYPLPYSGSATPYNDYLAETSPEPNNRRTMAVLLGDCRGLQNGDSDLPKVGNACVFLTEHAIDNGSEKKIMMEFVDSCPQLGTTSVTNPVFYGPTKVVLYKSAGSRDS